tara:strand:+ start:350 stop:1288 length:939 start_codon:yes stop_codon:yes gene_type:complete
LLKKNKILFISGPTTSGKSSLALNIASRINGEIINADSMQVYKDLKIITARPSAKDEKKIIHHLYGHKLGSERYNVYKWCNESLNQIKKIVLNNKVPIVVGGTGLYIHSLINGIYNIPNIPEYLKKESDLRLKKIGANKFFNEVKKLDPVSIKKIKEKDFQRLKRLWEIYEHVGISFSDLRKKEQKNFLNDYEYFFILMLPTREFLYENCNSRFIKMIKDGAVEEVRNLKNKNYNQDLPIMKAHGVPEIIDYLSGKINLEDAISKSQQNTRNYVRRQFTWWKGSKIEPNKIFNEFPSNSDLNSLKILKKLTN